MRSLYFEVSPFAPEASPAAVAISIIRARCHRMSQWASLPSWVTEQGAGSPSADPSTPPVPQRCLRSVLPASLPFESQLGASACCLTTVVVPLATGKGGCRGKGKGKEGCGGESKGRRRR